MTLFMPAIALMGRLKISSKFMLVSILFVLPLALTATLLIGNIQDQIAFTQKELTGAEYIKATQSLLQHIQQHRALTVALRNGNADLQPKVEAKQTEIAADIQSLELLDKRYGAELKSSERWQALVAAW